MKETPFLLTNIDAQHNKHGMKEDKKGWLLSGISWSTLYSNYCKNYFLLNYTFILQVFWSKRMKTLDEQLAAMKEYRQVLPGVCTCSFAAYE